MSVANIDRFDLCLLLMTIITISIAVYVKFQYSIIIAMISYVMSSAIAHKPFDILINDHESVIMQSSK